MKQSTTLQDIADAAGVSRAAVSRCLRNDPRHSLATRKKVQDTAKRLGYKTNSLVSAWMTHIKTSRDPTKKSPDTIAVINPFPRKQGWRSLEVLPRFWAGVQYEAKRNNLTLDIIDLNAPDMSSRRFNEILDARGVRGGLVMPFPNWNGVLDLDLSKAAWATMGYSLKSPILHRTVADHNLMIKRAMERLLESGHQRIGFAISEKANYRANGQWVAAFSTHQQTLVDPENRIPILLKDFANKKDAHTYLTPWYQNHRPDAILSNHPFIPEWARRVRVRIPDQLSWIAINYGLKLSGISQIVYDWRGMGRSTVQLIIQQIIRNETGIPRVPQISLHPGKLIIDKTFKKKV